MSSYQSMSFENSDPTSGTNSGPKSMGLTSFFHKVGMDDYEIKPTEIELMTNADGTVCVLGRGGFGQVRQHDFALHGPQKALGMPCETSF